MDKSRNKFLYMFVIGLFFSLVLLTGCTSKQKESTSKKIHFVCDSNPIRQQQIDLFNKYHPDIKVNVDFAPGTGSKVLTLIAGGNPPDVFMVVDFDLIDLAKRGILEPLDDYIENDPKFENDYFPAVLREYQYNGRTYALPANCTPTVVFYNRNVFDKQNLPYPRDDWKWEDFKEIARNLTLKDSRGRVIQFGAILEGTTTLYNLIVQNGGRLFNENATCCIINSPESLEALRFYKSLHDEHLVPLESDTRTVRDIDVFSMGKAGMMIAGRWRTIYLRKVGLTSFSFAPLFSKSGKGENLVYGMGWTMPKDSNHKKEAWALIKFLCQREGFQFVVDSGDGISPFISMASSSEFLNDKAHPNENNIVLLKAMEVGFTWPCSLYITKNRVTNIIKYEIDKCILGQQEDEKALVNIEKRINNVIEKNR